MKVLLTVLLLLIAGMCFGSIMPADRTSVAWLRENVGVEGGIPDSSNMTIHATVAAGASLATLNAALSGCPSNQVVQLSTGTYNFAGNVVIPTGVVLRGAGMSNTIIVFTSGSIAANSFAMTDAVRNGNYGGGGTANWTAGYAQNTSNLTFSTTSPGLTVGNYVYLDQANDTFYVNSLGYFATPETGPRDANHDMGQIVKVTAVNGNTVTIWPPIAATWWSSSLGPRGTWTEQANWKSRVGIENLTVDGTSTTGTGGFESLFDFESAHDCWVKGVKSIKCPATHVLLGYASFRCEVRDSYFYDTQSQGSTSYGVTTIWASSCLCENNVFEKIVSPLQPNGTTGPNVYAYNYATNDWYTLSANFLIGGINAHAAHSYMELFEGNHVPEVSSDFIHGSHSHEVYFRNRITGWEAYSYPSGPTVNALRVMQVDLTNRYCSSVGNILGTAGIYSQYQSVPGASLGYEFNGVIYSIGINKNTVGGGGFNDSTTWSNDTYTWSTFYRHMDYDTVTGGITYNPTNADVTLPSSLVYSSTPSWWGCIAWPPFNPTNTTAAAIDPTNLPAGYWRVYGRYPPNCFPPTATNVHVIAIGPAISKGQVIIK